MRIFLDIDGVLTSPRGHRKGEPLNAGGESNVLDPLSVAVLNAITGATGAELVIVSSRRHTNSRDSMERYLRAGGVTAPLAEDWAIRDAYDGEGHVRGAAVEEYCAEHQLKHEDYLIIDDMAYGYSYEQYKRLVQPNVMKGLLPEDFELASAMLDLPHAAKIAAQRSLAAAAAQAGVGKSR